MKLRGVASAPTVAAGVAAADGDALGGAMIAAVGDACVGLGVVVVDGGLPEHAERSSALSANPRIALTDQAAKAA